MVMVDIDLRPDTFPRITQVMTREEVYSGLRRLATLPFLIMDQVLMLMRKLDIVPRRATLPPINQLMMREKVDLGIKKPATIPF